MSYHFGHCPYFVIVELDENKVLSAESAENPFADEHSEGDFPSFMKANTIDLIITKLSNA